MTETLLPSVPPPDAVAREAEEPTPVTARFAPGRVRAVTVALVLVTALASFESTVVSTAMPT
ncbi:MAG: hypothetical protein DMF78_26540, partial [Acidobacteria bacterium]